MSDSDDRFLMLGRLEDIPDHDWRTSNKKILWGWKRNVGMHSRLVFYSAKLVRSDAAFFSCEHHFHYVHRTERDIAEEIAGKFGGIDSYLNSSIGRVSVTLRRQDTDLATVTVSMGQPSVDDRLLIRRLKSRRRRIVNSIPVPEPNETHSPESLFPADLYIGSGVSYEAGVPTLCDMHRAFGVDQPDGSGFAVGRNDPLPQQMAAAPKDCFREFAAVHVAALAATPSPSHFAIRDLYRRGMIGKIFSDNVDNLIAKVGVPFERTRGSGVMNELYPATFASKTLIVIGVAADRRRIIHQARQLGLKIVIVNPCQKVSPNVQHLNYVRPGSDLFFKCTAQDFFSRLPGESL